MPLDALKHRCLDYIKSERVYLECFEQASFSHALCGEHLAQRQGLELGIERSLRELGDADFCAQIDGIRRAHFPLDIKAQIFKLLATERLKSLAVMMAQTPGGSMEERYAASMFAATEELYDFVFASQQYAKIAAFFNDARLIAAFYEHDKTINLPTFEQLFDWPAEPKAAQKAAAAAFSHLLRGKNRRASFLRFDARNQRQFGLLRDFFARQEEIFKQLISTGGAETGDKSPTGVAETGDKKPAQKSARKKPAGSDGSAR